MTRRSAHLLLSVLLTLVSALAFFYTYQNRRYRRFEQDGDGA